MVNFSRGEYQGNVYRTVSASGLLIGLTDYNQQHFTSSLHSHENPHLSFGLKGQMAVGRKSRLGLNTAVEQCSFVRAGELHQITLATSLCKNINLELEPEFLNTYGLQESDFERVAQLPGTLYTMLRLYKEFHIQDATCQDSIHTLVLGLVQQRLPAGSKAIPGWVHLIRELLQDNWNKENSLQELALAASVHPVNVSKYFSRYFGCSLGEYRRRLKIERAVRLMTTTDQSLTEISYQCAFFDQSHFIRAFKEATGLSPTQFIKGI